MSSTLFKAVFAGAVTAGALLLPVTAAQAAGKHIPCDGPGFGHGAFFGDDLGFDDDFGFQDDFIGFPRHRWHRPTVIVIHDAPKRHHHKPAVSSNGADDGYSKPSKPSKPSKGNAPADNDGYDKGNAPVSNNGYKSAKGA